VSDRKLLNKFIAHPIVVRVYEEFEWEEYVARLYINGKEHEDSSYHTNDREDCVGTALFIFNHALKRAKVEA